MTWDEKSKFSNVIERRRNRKQCFLISRVYFWSESIQQQNQRDAFRCVLTQNGGQNYSKNGFQSPKIYWKFPKILRRVLPLESLLVFLVGTSIDNFKNFKFWIHLHPSWSNNPIIYSKKSTFGAWIRNFEDFDFLFPLLQILTLSASSK